MDQDLRAEVDAAQQAALDVLTHNARQGRSGLSRTAGWGYPEPYTRDLMVSSLGVLVSGSTELAESLEKTLRALAEHQSPLGLIPGLADDAGDLGASDTTPLFLIGLSVYRRISGNSEFLGKPAARALRWMKYQSPSDRVLTAQQPTSDWRDEQWVFGFGLYVNALTYTFLRLYRDDERADILKREINRPVGNTDCIGPDEAEGLAFPRDPYYALWSYKLYSSRRFDLLGNSLMVLSGAAPRGKAQAIIDWVETSCDAMRSENILLGLLPPNLFPFIQPGDADWHTRYEKFNKPSEYHNGGIWPFVCGFYIAALVAAERRSLAEEKLAALTEFVRRSKKPGRDFGFNEWFRAGDGYACGQDWQTWSAAMYLYAAACVDTGKTPLFDEIRGPEW